MSAWMTVALNHTDTGILFELWNEPSSNTEEEEGGDLEYWKKYRPYWRVLTDVIRDLDNLDAVAVLPDQVVPAGQSPAHVDVSQVQRVLAIIRGQ